MTVTIETQKLKSCSMQCKLLNKLKVSKKRLKVAEKLPSNLWTELEHCIICKASRQLNWISGGEGEGVGAQT